MAKQSEILDNFKNLLTHVSGPLSEVTLEPTSSVNNPQKNSVLFVPNQNELNKALDSEASLIIVDQKLSEQVKAAPPKQTIFSSNNLQLSMALINQKFFTPANYKKAFNKINGYTQVLLWQTL